MDSTRPGAGKTVMVVDDQPDFRLATEHLLILMGFRVVCAANGEEALKQLKTEKVDVILTDLFMPEMDGIELMMELRQSYRAVPPVVAITGDTHYAALLVGDAVAELGARAVLMKPFTADQLAGTIGFACSSAASGRPRRPHLSQDLLIH